MKKQKSKLFSRKFRNWLLGLIISRQDLKSVLGYTINALKQDGAKWQAKLDLLEPLYDDFDTGLTARAGAGAQRAGQTLLADTVFGLIKAFMKRAYKKNFAALEADDAVLFKKFFPEGRSQFSGSTRQTIGTAFPAFVQTLTANEAAVPGGAALLTDAKVLQQQWNDARTAQDARKSQVRTASTELAADETDILVELFGTYAALLAEYYKTPERAMDYFDFSVLPQSYRLHEDDTPPAA